MHGRTVFALTVLGVWLACRVPAATFTDGFEAGVLDSGWLSVYGYYPSVVTSADGNRILPHSGNYMAYTPQNYAVSFPCVRHTVGTASAGTMTVYVNSRGFNASYIFSIAIIGPNGSTIRVMNGGPGGTAVLVSVPSGNTVSGIAITELTWHAVKFIVSPTNGTDVYWDGTLVLSGEMSIVAVDRVEFGTNWGCAGAGYDDFSFVPSTANGGATSVTGTVIPDGYTGDLQNVSVKIELIQGGSVVRTVRTNLDATGKFNVPVVPSDIYDVAFKSYGHLRTVLTGRTISGPSTDLGTVTLVNGDVDGDNGVTSTDLAIALANLDQTGDL